MSLFAAFDAVVGVAHSAIGGFAALLTPIAGGTAAAVAIVLFTVAVRLLISPLSYLQIRGERRRAAVAPRLAELQRKHRDDPATLAAETLVLYRANGASPLAGLVPGLVQAPFYMVMYRVALHAPAGSFLGVPLSAHLFAGLPAFAVLIAMAAALAWLSSHRIRRASATASARAKPPAGSLPMRPPKPAPILDLWSPFRRSKPDMRQPPLQDRGKKGRSVCVKEEQSDRAQEGWSAPGKEERSDRGNKGRPDRWKERRPDRANEAQTAGGEGRQSDGPVLAVLMPWLPFLAVPAVAWLPLAAALYLVTSMTWTAVERSLFLP
jgi:YidC/Oxa1 family membrane protein insertase